MIAAAILIEQYSRVSRHVQGQQKVFVEPPAAHYVSRMLACTNHPHGKKAQGSGILQLLQLEKWVLDVSREAFKCRLGIPELRWPLGRGNDRSASIKNFQKIKLTRLRHRAGQIEVLGEVRRR